MKWNKLIRLSKRRIITVATKEIWNITNKHTFMHAYTHTQAHASPIPSLHQWATCLDWIQADFSNNAPSGAGKTCGKKPCFPLEHLSLSKASCHTCMCRKQGAKTTRKKATKTESERRKSKMRYKRKPESTHRQTNLRPTKGKIALPNSDTITGRKSDVFERSSNFHRNWWEKP